ncbi:hypothetical protein, partial [Streptococcus dysgalactiae]|uniref:hypothetical protein n=1 Tax=Streptococcus dysgalactiae TaxID=1334 RepID=UPI00194EDF8F
MLLNIPLQMTRPLQIKPSFPTVDFLLEGYGSMQFSQSVYDITIDHEPTNSSEVIGRVEIMNALAEKYVCYWTSTSGLLNPLISVDPETGDVRLSTAVTMNSKSFEVAVYASTGGCSSHSEAEAIIRVHVSCVLTLGAGF